MPINTDTDLVQMSEGAECGRNILVAWVVEAMALTYLESDPMSRNGRPPQVHGTILPRTVIRDLDRHLRAGNTFAPAGSDERGAAA